MAISGAISSGGSSSDGSIIINPTPADLNVSGLTIELTAGENVAFGDICYIESDGKMYLADADAAGEFPAQFMAAATTGTNATGNFFMYGIARNDAWNWTVGGTLYLSDTAGDITQTPPATSGDCIQVLGFATSADRIFFNPSQDYTLVT